MLPTPFINYIPKYFNRDAALQALATKTDEHLALWRSDALDLNTIIDPVRMPETILDDVGEYLSAGIVNQDSERIKRQKIWDAISSHRLRGTWQFDVKLVVDRIAGGDAQLVSNLTDAYWVLTDGTTVNNWSAFGFQSLQGFDGIILTGGGDEEIFPGNVRIDVDNATLTPAEVEQIKAEILESAGYLRIILGYLVAGEFVEYPNGRIE